MNTLTFTITQLQNIIIIIPILSIGVIQAEGNLLKVTLIRDNQNLHASKPVFFLPPHIAYTKHLHAYSKKTECPTFCLIVQILRE